MIGAEILTRAMFESGTSVVFSLSGNQIMPIYDACLEPGIRIVHVRHESAAVFMADAYAQIVSSQNINPQNVNARVDQSRVDAQRSSGTCGVALVTAGPGFANALGGLYSALMAESPVVLISGDSAVAQDGKRAFQEVSQTTASTPFVKHAMRVTDVDKLAQAWLECIAIATSGRPGPVHLAVPFDVLLARASKPHRPSSGLQSGTPVSLAESTLHADLTDITSALLAAKKPLVLTGPAMTPSRMHERFRRLQKVLGLPVIAMESPRGLADPSLGKLATVIDQADCILLLGKLPDFTLGFADSAKVPAQTLIVVDANEQSLRQSMSVLADRVPSTRDGLPGDTLARDTPGVDISQDEKSRSSKLQGRQGIMAVHGNPAEIADALCNSYSRSADHTQWLAFTEQQLNAVPQASVSVHDPVHDSGNNSGQHSGNNIVNDQDKQIALGRQAAVLTPQQVGDQVQKAVDQCAHSILVCDGGEFGQWAQACVRSELRVINGPSGAIGGSLPQAVAAKIAKPECVVFAMLGDGTAGFHLAELETSVREQAPVVVIIGNDSRWNAEYQIQLRDYGADRLHSCELGVNVRYDMAAAGLGCAGAMVETEAELTVALSDAVSRSRQQGQSTCINVSMLGWPAPVFE